MARPGARSTPSCWWRIIDAVGVNFELEFFCVYLQEILILRARLQRGGAVNTNLALGANALYSNTTGYDNLALGANALYSNTTGYQNVCIGTGFGLYSNTTGYDNLALGANALYGCVTGNNNIAIGPGSLSAHRSGYYNVVQQVPASTMVQAAMAVMNSKQAIVNNAWVHKDAVSAMALNPLKTSQDIVDYDVTTGW
ncbi:MAG: hypothetical protein ACYC3G_04195 [Minisyncoccota bacterium]